MTSGSRHSRAQALLDIAAAAVEAADPARAVAAHLPPPPKTGRVAVFAAGKAAPPMAWAVEEAWGDLDGRLVGCVAANDAAHADLRRLEVLEASHPTPDARSVAAAARFMALAEDLRDEDFALALISGGGSALLAAPSDGLTLGDKRAVNDALLASGAAIHEVNAVRKRLSAIKGGRLARRIYPARLLTLAISDAPGDDPAVIASGPTAPDPTTNADARRVIEKYGLGEVCDAELFEETPKPGDPIFERADYQIVASPTVSLAAAKASAAALGWRVVSLGDAVEGEARKAARAHAAEALRVAEQAEGAPVALISGGELTVTIRGGASKSGASKNTGRGGPNREYALALALALNGHPRIAALAMDTDGADGAPAADGAPVAGALIFPDTRARADAAGLDPAAALANHASGDFFAALGDDLRTGHTGTNVNDLRLIVVDPAP